MIIIIWVSWLPVHAIYILIQSHDWVIFFYGDICVKNIDSIIMMLSKIFNPWMAGCRGNARAVLCLIFPFFFFLVSFGWIPEPTA